MNLQSERLGDTLKVRVNEARIDAAVAVQFKDAFREAVTDPARRVVLDLEEVEFLDSSGLGSIVAAMKLLAPDRRLELAALTETVSKVFRLTRMDTVFIIHPDIDSAMDAPANAT